MKRLVAGLVLLATPVLAQTYSVPPTSGPAANGSPGWHLAPSYPDPTGHTMVDASGKVTVVQRQRGVPDPIRATDDVPGCRGATICGRRGGFPRGQMLRVNWDTMPGWTPEYIYHLPPGLGGLPSVGLDSKGNLWAFQRRAPGEAQLMKFDTNHKLVLSVGDDVIGHQSKAHGLAVDADDNVWITDAGYSTVIKLSPQGKVLMTLGTRGKRGDWDEAKGQRLSWQPVMVAFGKNNDVYIAEGHANESPNDAGGPDPARPLFVDLESRFDPALSGQLAQLGHDVVVGDNFNTSFGHAQMILRDADTGLLRGGADPRADGVAIGW